MKFDLDSWEEIFITLSRNKSRSLLTAFGVFWGIFMLIVLIGLGNGLEQLMTQNFEGSSQNTSIVGSRRTSIAYKGFQKGRIWNFQNKDITILEDIEGVDIACPVLSVWGSEATYNQNKSAINSVGTSPSYDKIQPQDILYGRFINGIDMAEKRKVCTIGDQVYNNLFPFGGDPLGEYIEIHDVQFQIIGVIKANDSGMTFGGNPKQQVIMPITTMQTIYNRGDNIDFFFLSGEKGYAMSQLQEKIEAAVKEAHTIAPSDPQGIFFLNTEAMYQMVSSLLTGIHILIWLVGIGTLLAGIIGVSNIMMITVKERTTEFGIRRAIGALQQDILGQVVLESIVITLLAGTAGIALGVLTLSGVEKIASQIKGTLIHFQISFWVAIGVFVALIALGILAGMAPAYRALAIKPIDAIRE